MRLESIDVAVEWFPVDQEFADLVGGLAFPSGYVGPDVPLFRIRFRALTAGQSILSVFAVQSDPAQGFLLESGDVVFPDTLQISMLVQRAATDVPEPAGLSSAMCAALVILALYTRAGSRIR